MNNIIPLPETPKGVHGDPSWLMDYFPADDHKAQ